MTNTATIDTAAPAKRKGGATFVISGAAFTEHTHDRLRDFGYADAIRFMNASVPDCPLELAHQIAMGEKAFTGDSSTGFDTEDTPAKAEEIRTALEFTWAGVWYDRPSKWYFRPYATVTSYGSNDVTAPAIPNRFHSGYTGNNVPANLPGGGDSFMRWSMGRNIYYMDDRRNDRATAESNGLFKGVVLWRRIDGEPPFRWPVATTSREALFNFLKSGGKLEVKGAMAEPDENGERFTRMAPAAVTFEGTRYEEIAELGLPKQVRDFLGNESEPQPGPDYIPKRTCDPAGAKYAWLDRDGWFWPVTGYYRHLIEAPGIIAAAGVPVPIGRTPEAVGDSILEDAGWTKLRWEWKQVPKADHEGKGLLKQTTKQAAAEELWFAYWSIPR